MAPYNEIEEKLMKNHKRITKLLQITVLIAATLTLGGCYGLYHGAVVYDGSYGHSHGSSQSHHYRYPQRQSHHQRHPRSQSQRSSHSRGSHRG